MDRTENGRTREEREKAVLNEYSQFVCNFELKAIVVKLFSLVY